MRGDGFGGAERDRTDDLLNAIQALSQLSYGPTIRKVGEWANPVSKSKFHSAPRTIAEVSLC